jgi:hypothetical protein
MPRGALTISRFHTLRGTEPARDWDKLGSASQTGGLFET